MSKSSPTLDVSAEEQYFAQLNAAYAGIQGKITLPHSDAASLTLA
jgi:hypothetical protein